MAVRHIVHGRGLRYRVGIAPSPSIRRRADLVFTKRRVAVFIDGCFWHGCPEHGRKSFKHNKQYWSAKIAGNIARDDDTNARLKAAGWTVLRFWEHEDTEVVAQAIIECVQTVSPLAGL